MTKQEVEEAADAKRKAKPVRREVGKIRLHLPCSMIPCCGNK